MITKNKLTILFTSVLSMMLTFVPVSRAQLIQPDPPQHFSGGLMERLTMYLPIFTAPNCTTYLTDFGDKRKSVEHYAEVINLVYQTTFELPDREGIYVSIYLDPENLTDNFGKQVTEQILYSFTYSPDDRYISFTSSVEFKSTKMAESYMRTMLGYLESEYYTTKYNTLVKCNVGGKEVYRSVTLQFVGTTVTMAVVDYKQISKMMMKGSKI